MRSCRVLDIHQHHKILWRPPKETRQDHEGNIFSGAVIIGSFPIGKYPEICKSEDCEINKGHLITCKAEVLHFLWPCLNEKKQWGEQPSLL